MTGRNAKRLFVNKIDIEKPAILDVRYKDESHNVVVVKFDNGTYWIPKLKEIKAVYQITEGVLQWNLKHDKYGKMLRLIEALENSLDYKRVYNEKQ
jgi:hypothetical protein